MRAGDVVVLLACATSMVMVIVDGQTDGAVEAWIQTHLYSYASDLGSALAFIARYLAPLLAVPLLLAVAGRFVGLSSPVDQSCRFFIYLFDRISTIFGDAARWLALVLVLVTAIVVIQRYVFGFASTKLQESIIYFHALLFLLSAGSTLLADGHVRVDVIYAKLSERGKAWTDLIGIYFALMPMALLILWVSTPYINASWRILERSRESDGLPLIFLLKTSIPLFAVLLILQGIATALRSALVIAGRNAPGHVAAIDNEL